jgi:ATP-dependent Lon protease
MTIDNIDKIISNIPALPLRDVVVFPDMVFPLFIGRKKSINALEAAMAFDKQILLVTQKKPNIHNVVTKDVYETGCIGKIIQMLKLPDGTLKVLIESKKRVIIEALSTYENSFVANIKIAKEAFGNSDEGKSLTKNLKDKFKEYIRFEDRMPSDLANSILKINNSSKLADHIISSLPINIKQKQEILNDLTVQSRLSKVIDLLDKEYQVLKADNKIKDRVKTQVESSQREYYLNEQLKAIKKELGENSGESEDEIKIFEKLIAEKKLSAEAKKKALLELKKIKAMNPLSSEAGITKGYLEWLLNIPWYESSQISVDLQKSEDLLNQDHYALAKVKERILEFIAVNKRVKKIKGPILCLVGPPGVGKTSLAKSIAHSMGRKFVKMSLGGMRDEAEIRGHRRTYIGALPGKIIQLLKKVEVSNPLLLLDEIDKIGQDFRGDPASALLEVLDPEQNSKFSDHYLEVDYDLSDIIFITTANSLNIPHALADRMEIIRLSGYTVEEKLQIAKKHLIPKQYKYNGLNNKELSISDTAISNLISQYTYEAGVRGLERELANIIRKTVRKIDANKGTDKVTIGVKNLHKYAGISKFNYNQIEDQNLVGIVTGLAYTELGGDILAIESVKTPGEGKIITTGKLGDVMKESIHAAFSFFKSNSADFGILPDIYKKIDIHVHVPEGATPKDGPSAGIAIFTSIVSLITNIPVNRHVAMTGEITLRGRVLPIGGLKEKLLAALRGGIKTVIIPEKNHKDLSDIPDNIKKKINIIPISSVKELLPIALLKIPQAVKWDINKDHQIDDKRFSH